MCWSGSPSQRRVRKVRSRRPCFDGLHDGAMVLEHDSRCITSSLHNLNVNPRTDMRTTLDIDDDLLTAIKEMARSEGTTAGRVVSRLLRNSLTGNAALSRPTRASRQSAAGFEPFAAMPRVVTTNEQVRTGSPGAAPPWSTRSRSGRTTCLPGCWNRANGKRCGRLVHGAGCACERRYRGAVLSASAFHHTLVA